MNFEHFIEQFNNCFGSPWIREGIVKAKPDARGGLCFQIGNRDIQFDENLKFIGRGTALNEPKVVLLEPCPDCGRIRDEQHV